MSCKELCPVLGEDGTEEHIVSECISALVIRLFI